MLAFQSLEISGRSGWSCLWVADGEMGSEGGSMPAASAIEVKMRGENHENQVRDKNASLEEEQMESDGQGETE